jgi:hypothetical protein
MWLTITGNTVISVCSLDRLNHLSGHQAMSTAIVFQNGRVCCHHSTLLVHSLTNTTAIYAYAYAYAYAFGINWYDRWR